MTEFAIELAFVIPWLIFSYAIYRITPRVWNWFLQRVRDVSRALRDK